MDLSQTEGDDEICPSNAHSTLSAKLSSAEEDVHSLLNLPLEDAAEAGKFKLSVLARALRAAAAEGSFFDEVSHRKPSWCGSPERETPSICNRMPLALAASILISPAYFTINRWNNPTMI